ncbi:hypothetical protein FH972_025863 [Carpinus fangiana]|uniref:Anaphase-promoting complex subunit 4 WD40 domain-containing protein n=1 Tax=Carpinus fangiana TaxID=176857 RepID=A0A5N6L2I1_9ROSI|nr:hypothetical protein FH972_025863 [Carpinus fangiana]
MSPEGSVAEQEKIDFDYRVETCPIEYLTDSLDGKDDDDAVMTLRDEMKVYRSFARARYWHADEKYIAVGGATADLRIWNVQSGELVQKVTIDKGDEASGQQQQEEYVDGHLLEQSWVVRDVSWHPTQPIVAAGSWWSGGNGKLGRSTVHDFRGCLSRDEELGDNDWVKVD